MDSWTKQQGYPVIQVSLKSEALVIEQVIWLHFSCRFHIMHLWYCAPQYAQGHRLFSRHRMMSLLQHWFSAVCLLMSWASSRLDQIWLMSIFFLIDLVIVELHVFRASIFQMERKERENGCYLSLTVWDHIRRRVVNWSDKRPAFCLAITGALLLRRLWQKDHMK